MFNPDERNPDLEKHKDEEIIDEAVARLVSSYRRRGGSGLAGVSFRIEPRWNSYEIEICNSQEFIRGRPVLKLIQPISRQEEP